MSKNNYSIANHTTGPRPITDLLTGTGLVTDHTWILPLTQPAWANGIPVHNWNLETKEEPTMKRIRLDESDGGGGYTPLWIDPQEIDLIRPGESGQGCDFYALGRTVRVRQTPEEVLRKMGLEP